MNGRRSTAQTSVTSSRPTSDIASAIDVEALQLEMEKLRDQLRLKELLCSNLEMMLERLLAAKETPTANSKDQLSCTRFNTLMKKWRSQVWFEVSVPLLVDATFEKLAMGMQDMYRSTNRRTAFTMTECFNLVDTQIRHDWERQFPPAISESLALSTRVYSSKAESRDPHKGETCEASHYLVYIVHKLYNRAAQVLAGMKKSDAISGLALTYPTVSSIAAASTSTIPGVSSTDTMSKFKWHENPILMLREAIKTVRPTIAAKQFSAVSNLEHMITITEAKLVGNNAPKPDEALKYLASIIVFTEVAKSLKWKLKGEK